MSLIGSLEDLGLGDILQIISLSQKSGVLVIRSDEDEGRIVFENGLIRGAVVKGGPLDLRGVLVDGGFLTAEEHEAAVWVSDITHISIEEAIAQSTSITAERIDTLRRECVESAVVRMFRWRFGDFSFDVRDKPDPDDPPPFLPVGINAQYLAMEGARLDDEAERPDEAEEASQSQPPPTSGDESVRDLFGVVEDDDDPEQEEDNEPVALVEGPPQEFVSVEPVVEEPAGEVLAAELVTEESAPAVQAETEMDTQAETMAARPEAASALVPPLVAIDADLEVLEWLKQTLTGRFPRIHILQSCELGLARIRQYLARAHTPLVLLSPDAPGDRMGGVRDPKDLAKRLKAQAPNMSILWFCEEGVEPAKQTAGIAGVVKHPPVCQLQNPKAAAMVEKIVEQLRSELDLHLTKSNTAGSARRDDAELSPQALRSLRTVTARLSDAAARGEVLPEVIRFAAETFSRVAMFVVREDQVLGMAQQGLERGGGPDDDGLRGVRLEKNACAWFRAVLEGHAPVRAAPSDAGDRALAGHLGDSIPAEAYVAPIECAGQVVALLYADNLPSGDSIKDTSALEVVLHHAGLSLDRAALERALAEVEGGGAA
ncbi:MAG: DUF4388 domain-containing protein [Myxococcota bacterium]